MGFFPGRTVIRLILTFSLLLAGGCGVHRQPEIRTPEELKEMLEKDIQVSELAWSADGRRAAGLVGEDSRVCLWGPDGTPVYPEIPPGHYRFLWAPEGTLLTVAGTREGGVEFLVADGRSGEILTDLRLAGGDPVWDPAGTLLAFSRREDDQGMSFGYLDILDSQKNRTDTLWKIPESMIQVTGWETSGRIIYQEIRKGTRTEKWCRNVRPAISGVRLGDTREKVEETLGTEFREHACSGEAGYFPEPVYLMEYPRGYQIFIGSESGRVQEILATAGDAVTSLGVPMGATAEEVFAVYRPRYREPVAFHGQLLQGVFQVEGCAELYFDFARKDEERFQSEVPPGAPVIGMALTRMIHVEGSF